MFFFKQQTAYEMRISDWSSDVCSSDLRQIESRSAFSYLPRVPDKFCSASHLFMGGLPNHRFSVEKNREITRFESTLNSLTRRLSLARTSEGGREIGRASCRERVCKYV